MNPITELNWLKLLLWGLATYRLALLFSKESGPGRIFKKLRKMPPPRSSAREGLSCLWCESIWMSAVVLALSHYGSTIGMIIILWLAVSALAIVINQQWTRN